MPKPGKKVTCIQPSPSIAHGMPRQTLQARGTSVPRSARRGTRHVPANQAWFPRPPIHSDALVQMHHDPLKDPVRAGTRALLGVDLRKAFDNGIHEVIVQRLAATNPGERTYNYVCSFLYGRTEELSPIDSNAKSLTLSKKGTPQGAVLSPFLFNLLMNQRYWIASPTGTHYARPT